MNSFRQAGLLGLTLLLTLGRNIRFCKTLEVGEQRGKHHNTALTGLNFPISTSNLYTVLVPEAKSDGLIYDECFNLGSSV